MRIALVSREYPPETGWGGIGTYVYQSAHALAREGHEVHVISRSERREESTRLDGPVAVHRIRDRKWRGPLADMWYRLLPITEWRYSRRVAEKVWELHRRHPFDVVEVPEYRAEGFHLVRHAPAPVIVKLHTPTYLLEELNRSPRSLHETLVRWMESKTAHHAQGVSAPSASLAKRVAAAWRLPDASVEVIPYPFDAACVPSQPFVSPDPTVLFVGRFETRKGVHVLAEAIPKVLSRLPQARCVFVGSPPNGAADAATFVPTLLDRFTQMGVQARVTVVPWQSPSKLLRYYRESHVVVVPSLYENFPNVVLEAMAAGRPVVGSRVGGIPEIVEDRVTGWLVAPGDVEALAEAIAGALAELPRAEAMGRAAAAHIAQRFSPRRIAQRTVDYCVQVIQRHHSLVQRDQRYEGDPAIGPSQQVGGMSPRTGRGRSGAAGLPAGLHAQLCHVLYTFTDRWIRTDTPEAVLVHLSKRHEALRAQGVQVTWLRFQRATRARARSSRVGELWSKWWDVASAPLDAWHILRQARPVSSRVDLVHEWYSLYGVSGLLLAWRSRKPLVFEVDALLLEEYTKLHGATLGRWRMFWAKRMLAANLRRASRVIVRSKVMAEVLAQQWDVPTQKLIVVPCGVDLPRFSQVQPAARSEAMDVVFLGSLQPWHGCDLLLSAFASVHRAVPAARLRIIGEGKMRSTLEQQAARLGLNGSVEFIGQVPHETVPQRLASAAVAVAPYPALSVQFYFSPMKLFEYMAAGNAIVASRIGQIGDVLAHEQTALLVEPGSVEQLAESIIRLLRDEPLRARLGRAAQASVGQYAWDQQAQTLATVYDEVLREAAHG